MKRPPFGIKNGALRRYSKCDHVLLQPQQGVGSDAVSGPWSWTALLYETRLLQHPQVLGDGRLSERDITSESRTASVTSLNHATEHFDSRGVSESP
jgi:hypothetical protein